MDPKKLKETIDSFVQGDYVYLRTEGSDKDKHTIMQYAGHRDYRELLTQSKRHGPVHGGFDLHIPGIMGYNTPFPLPRTGPISLEADKVRFITNDMQNAYEHLIDTGEELYAAYVKSIIKR